MGKIHKALAGLACLASAAAANAQSATVTYNSTTAIPTPQNNFYSQLTALGLNSYASTGANITLSGASTITFYFLGSESGYSDTFSTAGPGLNVSLGENSTLEDHFAAPILIGGKTFSAGSLINQLLFTTSGVGVGGANATVGNAGFGIFLPTRAGAGPGSISGLTTLYFGYDDQINNSDDNHDDFIVRAVITSAVPEPTTWALMLLGFGAVGVSMRRRRVRAHIMQVA